MREHVDDGTGVCSTQLTRVTWPCVLAGLTSRANEVRAVEVDGRAGQVVRTRAR